MGEHQFLHSGRKSRAGFVWLHVEGPEHGRDRVGVKTHYGDIQHCFPIGADCPASLLLCQRRFLQEEPHLAIGRSAEHAVLAGGFGRGISAQGNDTRPVESHRGGIEEHEGIACRDNHLAGPARPRRQFAKCRIETIEERQDHFRRDSWDGSLGTGEKILPHGP